MPEQTPQRHTMPLRRFPGWAVSLTPEGRVRLVCADFPAFPVTFPTMADAEAHAYAAELDRCLTPDGGRYA